MSEINLKKLADKLWAVAKKKQLDHKDVDTLREVKEGIAETVQTLKICDVCGKAVTEIARIEINGVKAAVCHDCGIKALKSKGLKVRASHRSAPTPRQKSEARSETPSHKPTPPKAAHPEAPVLAKAPHRAAPFAASEKKSSGITVPRPSEQTSLLLDSKPAAATQALEGADKFQEIAGEFGINMGVVKRIHQMAAGLAIPMDLEKTASYLRMEAVKERLPVDKFDLKALVSALVKKAGLKVKL